MTALLVLFAACGESNPATPADRVVADAVAAAPGWRAATAADCRSPGLAAHQRLHPEYMPYRVDEDLTGDGIVDLVFVLIRADSAHIVFAPGRTKGFAPSVRLVELGTEWRRMGLFVRDGALLVGEFSADAFVQLQWNTRLRRFDEVPDALPDSGGAGV